MIYSELYKVGVECLNHADISEAALDARLLLEYICKTDRNTLLAHPDRQVSEIEEKLYRDIIDKRSRHIPLQHLTGSQEFMGLEFTVSRDVLIPRMDTEFLVEEVLKYAQDGMRVLDICTGSGCILLSVMNYKNNIVGVGCDISDAALEIAKENAGRLGLPAVFLQGDLLDALDLKSQQMACELPEKYDIVISNPPYISEKECKTLMPEVKDYEPYIALCGGSDGLDFYRKIAKSAKDVLVNYGMLFFEIGYDQEESVPNILKDEGYSEVKCLRDYSHNPRVVIAKYIK